MKHFVRAQLVTFLRAVDKYATEPTRLVIIGGAAAKLAYSAPGGTMDIDTANNTNALHEACEKARKETGLDIPFGTSSVFEAPYEYESRLAAYTIPGVARLQLFVPEKHDWAFMKITRLYDKDIEHVKAVARTAGFNKSVFLNRFISEMTHIEPAKRLVGDFVQMMAELYGEGEAKRMEATIKRKWKL